MRVWLRYLKEKRVVLLLYFLTVFLFLMVGSLYQIENLYKLLYAFALTLALWAAAGFADGCRYVRKSRHLDEAIRLLQDGEGFSVEGLLGGTRSAEPPEAAESLEEKRRQLFFLVCDGRSRERKRWEEQTAERKDYFLMWTHQIKTPVSALKLLMKGEDRESFLMREELFKIEQYIEMVLSYQRLEDMSQDMMLQEYKLSPLLKHSAKKYAVLFINKKIRLELCETEADILTDEKWFSFCFEQILSNSIKYTEQGEIRIACSEREEDVILTIADTGLGIRAEDLPRIFEKGFTGYNGRMDKKATGIGLYLCRRICGRLGMEITVESAVGKGTTVRLFVPKTKKR